MTPADYTLAPPFVPPYSSYDNSPMTPWRSDRELDFTPLRQDEKELFPEVSSQNDAESESTLLLNRAFSPLEQCEELAEQSPSLTSGHESYNVEETTTTEVSTAEEAQMESEASEFLKDTPEVSETVNMIDSTDQTTRDPPSPTAINTESAQDIRNDPEADAR